MTETILIAVLCLLAGAGIAALVVYLMRPRQGDAPDEARAEIADLARQHGDTAARLEAMIGLLGQGQSQLAHNVNERLDVVTHRVQQTMAANTEKTVEQFQSVQERLAVIDVAQNSISELTKNAHKNMADLTTQVSALHGVLANKQTRGAFGQRQMEAILQDGLTKNQYELQYTLKSGKRPDCVVFLPDQRPLVIDAKFPLESITMFRECKTDDERKAAIQRVRQDVMKHVSDIAERYIVPGETQDTALMFVPSESVYADLHDSFGDVVEKAYRSQVMIVSPTLLMLAIQVIRQIQKDAQMREATDRIRNEVGYIMKDVKLLGDRVRKLQAHFGQSSEDLNNILISTGRIEKRAGNIEGLEFSGDEAPSNVIPAPMTRKLEVNE
jgi:DNA recombination protein RmuC